MPHNIFTLDVERLSPMQTKAVIHSEKGTGLHCYISRMLFCLSRGDFLRWTFILTLPTPGRLNWLKCWCSTNQFFFLYSILPFTIRHYVMLGRYWNFPNSTDFLDQPDCWKPLHRVSGYLVISDVLEGI